VALWNSSQHIDPPCLSIMPILIRSSYPFSYYLMCNMMPGAFNSGFAFTNYLYCVPFRILHNILCWIVQDLYWQITFHEFVTLMHKRMVRNKIFPMSKTMTQQHILCSPVICINAVQVRTMILKCTRRQYFKY